MSGLGVAILLADLKVGNAYLANTASRKDEIVAEINCILESGKLLPTKALQLHGRMHFATGQLYGRTGKAAVRLLSKHAHGRTGVQWTNSCTLPWQNCYCLSRMERPAFSILRRAQLGTSSRMLRKEVQKMATRLDSAEF